MQRLVILGGGTAGTIMANKLANALIPTSGKSRLLIQTRRIITNRVFCLFLLEFMRRAMS